MLSTLLPDPIWISTPADLESIAREIEKSPVIAIDTESNSLFAYKEKVCLIQISTPRTDYLIDPLVLTDLSCLAPIFANPNQLKIFHACEYDLICLKRDFSFEVNNIFDTMIAARILGEVQIGLGSLLTSRFEIQLDKRYQRANWGTRPLSAVMLDYARMDTHFLFALKDLLEIALKDAGLLDLALEDFQLISQTEPHPVENNNISCWKVAGAVRISPQEAAILNQLCLYRDHQAQIIDLPHFKVLSNDLLVELCQQPPETFVELEAFPGVSEKIMRKHGKGLISALDLGRHAKPLHREPRLHCDADFLKRLDKLRIWRKELAKLKKVESDIVLPREMMEEIASRSPRNLDELGVIMHQSPWRFRNYGTLIFSTLSPEA